MIVFLLSISCISVGAIDTKSDKQESLLNLENENISKNKSDKEIILNCVSKRTPKSRIEGNSYIFIFKDGKLYDEDNILLKKQTITDSTFRFTYKKRQDFTLENLVLLLTDIPDIIKVITYIPISILLQLKEKQVFASKSVIKKYFNRNLDILPQFGIFTFFCNCQTAV